MSNFLFRLKIKAIIKIEDWIIKPIESIPLKIAVSLPKKVQLWCFILVAGCDGGCPSGYKEMYDSFVLKHKEKLKGMY